MKGEGRHRVADGQAADTRAHLIEGDGPVLPRGPGSLYTVQDLAGHWFVGPPGAAQKIEDAASLDAWLSANGAIDRRVLDFGGDAQMERRFWAAMSETESS